ncbi:LTA synthase family protein [Desulfitibacter alkalitolerans]|uniref:LTA synthase family protein n=1 Tax=Desulfitibacter alkalitolerans TaxID=264641 RepID=UPI00146FABF9|nr:LTA synthase family protein [Desulfitibacter alkalitolerans]
MNILISILLFIDLVYYTYFFTLTPVQSIYQLKQLTPVSESIKLVLKPLYSLLFIDSLLLGFYYYRHRAKTILEKHVARQIPRKPVLAIIIVLTILVASFTHQSVKDAQGYFTPHNLGAFKYHLYDIASFFLIKPLDIIDVEAIADTISQETSEQIGFGLAKGRNVFVIQAESVQGFVINQQINGQYITPVLNDLINKETLYFSNFYEQVGWGNTSDSEFVTHNSYYPSTKVFSYKAYENNTFFTLPMLLKEHGYANIVFHGFEASFWNREAIYPSQGIDTFISLEKFEPTEIIGLGLSDGQLFEQSLAHIKNMPRPFYSFYITLTSHHPYTMENEHKMLNIKDPFKDTMLENYLQTVHYFDQQLGVFIETLKAHNLYDNSIIVIYGDHQGLDARDEETNNQVSEFLGKQYTEAEMYQVPFIIHIPNSQVNQEITLAGGQLDILPTLANLLGIKINSKMFFGKDLLNTDEGFVATQINTARGSFIDNEKIFIMSNDGIFENSRAWYLTSGEPVDIEECMSGYERALAEIALSEYIMQNNLISVVKENGLDYILKEYLSKE